MFFFLSNTKWNVRFFTSDRSHGSYCKSFCVESGVNCLRFDNLLLIFYLSFDSETKGFGSYFSHYVTSPHLLEADHIHRGTVRLTLIWRRRGCNLIGEWISGDNRMAERFSTEKTNLDNDLLGFLFFTSNKAKTIQLGCVYLPLTRKPARLLTIDPICSSSLLVKCSMCSNFFSSFSTLRCNCFFFPSFCFLPFKNL